MKRMAPALAGFAAMMVYALATTAIVWKVPNAGDWVLGATLVLVAIVLALCYWAARRAVPADFKGSKWAAAVFVFGGTASNTIGFGILMGVILTGAVLALVWPDRPRWVFWLELLLTLALATFFIFNATRKNNPSA